MNINRRKFLLRSTALSGSFLLTCYLPAARGAQGSVEISHWIVIDPDETVRIRIARSELGQGSFTGLAMLVAEELECDWDKVRAEYADVNEHVRRNRIFGAMSTGGSRAIRDSHDYLRKAGAAARQMLVAAAAQQWSVGPGECTVAKGVVTHHASGRSATFGKLAAAAAKQPVPKEPKLKDPRDWQLLGTSPPRFDIPAKTTGKQVYAADVRLPGMVHASIVQSPVFGGKLKGYDEAAVLGRRGVKKVVAGPDWVAVVADNWWRANEALKVLPVEWDEAGNGVVSSVSIRDFLASGLDASDVPIARKDGDSQGGFALAAATIEADYYAPFLNHATMEPQTATALVDVDRVEVWVGTQNGESSIAAAAEAAAVPLEKVHLHRMHAGGGFGRRGLYNEYIKQAIRIAQTMPGTAVRLQWSREEDMRQGRYRPVALVRQRAALDQEGRWIAWHVRQSEQSFSSADLPQFVKNGIDQIGARVFIDHPYAVANFTHEYAMRNTHVPPGPMRAVAHTHNPFFRECFIDELAHLAKADPVAFRRPMLTKRPKDLAVLDAAARAIGWGQAAAPGIYRGIAVSDAYGSFTAAAVELSIENKVIDVKRVVVALDCGYFVHRDAVIAQVEGGVIWGLSLAMHEEITIKDGRVEQGNFHDYPVLRLFETPPKIEAVLVPSGGFWGGVGEPPIAAVPAALGNALFAATGERLRMMPFKHAGYSYA